MFVRIAAGGETLDADGRVPAEIAAVLLARILRGLPVTLRPRAVSSGSWIASS